MDTSLTIINNMMIEKLQQIIDRVTSNATEIIDLLKEFNFEWKTPNYLYHYRRANRGIQEIQSGSMFLCPTDEFNDPYDSLIPIEKIVNNGRTHNQIIEITKDIFNEIFDEFDEDIYDFDLNELYESFIDITKGIIRICCLSETNESFAMWDRYADGYKGICIKYDMNKVNKELIKSFFRVNYSPKLFDCNEKIEDEILYLLLTIIGSILTKHTDYSYEREWRYFSLPPNNEYISVPETIDCVYIGTDCSDEDYNAIVNLCHSKNIHVIKMKMRSDSFGFDYIPIKNNLIE